MWEVALYLYKRVNIINHICLHKINHKDELKGLNTEKIELMADVVGATLSFIS